ncbi:unnamed protein product [Victoria cruziana]
MTGRKAIAVQDPAWEHCREAYPGDRDRRAMLICKYCENTYNGGVARIKEHLAQTHYCVAPCKSAPPDVVQFFKKFMETKGTRKRKRQANMVVYKNEDLGDGAPSDGFTSPSISKVGSSKGPMDKYVNPELRQITINETSKKEKRKQVCSEIGKFFFAHALPFNLCNSTYFTNMCESLGDYGRGFKPPSYHEMRTWILKKEVDDIRSVLENCKKSWIKTGCTLMVDGWTDGKGRNLINFLVNNPAGTFFIKSCDISGVKKSIENLIELFVEVIKDIGAKNVVQIITDNDVNYKAVGLKLKDIEGFQHIYWIPCATHCLDLMLEDISKIHVHKQTIDKAKSITTFIYGHAWVLSLMRKFTNNKELLRPAITRFATCYLTLQSIRANKRALKNMFISSEFQESDYYREHNKGKEVAHIINEDPNFWKAISYILKVALPLVKVLRVADSDEYPTMGFIYHHMRKAKEEIAFNVDNDKKKYEKIWEIIDNRWTNQMYHSLYAAAYYLNPNFYYDDDGDKDIKVKAALLQCVEKMVTNIEERCDIFFQLRKYEDGIGYFQKPEAILTRKGQQPAAWWNIFGIQTEELMNFAMRILSLTCSVSRCKHNRGTFSLVHTKGRNHLEQDKLNALVFVMYYMKLNERQTKKRQVEDPLIVEHIDSDDEWVIEKEDLDLPTTLVGTWLDSNLDIGNIDVLPLDNLIGSKTKNKDTSFDRGKRKINNEDEIEDGKKSTKDEDRSPAYMGDSNEDPSSTHSPDEVDNDEIV